MQAQANASSYQEKGRSYPVFRPKIEIYPTAAQVSTAAAKVLLDQIKRKPRSKFILSTGQTYIPIYRSLVKLALKDSFSLKLIKTFNQDEYWPLDPKSPDSYAFYMKRYLFDPAGIPKDHRHVPLGNAQDPIREAERYEKLLAAHGPTDLAALGLGPAGSLTFHLGFNEPGPDSFRQSRSRLISLSPRTIRVNGAHCVNPATLPKQALTIGIGTIMDARSLLIVATGAHKAKGIKHLLTDKIGWHCPATYIRTHPDAH